MTPPLPADIFQKSVAAALAQQGSGQSQTDNRRMLERHPALPSIDYSALHYLNDYLRQEEDWLTVMRGCDKPRKLGVMKEFAGVYRIARNFPVEHDKSGSRFEKILQIIDSLNASDFEGDDVAEQIKRTERRIAEQYDGRNCLSATTKFLWLKLRSPIIIYDSQARLALGSKDGDLSAFYDRWRHAYSVYADDIAVACQKLAAVRQYSVMPSRVTEEFIETTTSQRWFHERVFDMFLWNIGGRKVTSAKDAVLTSHP
jgi:hypothetical protein